jgi:rod shape-determining protein MreB
VLALEGTVATRSLATGSEDLFERLRRHVESVHGVVLDAADLHAAAHLLVAAIHEERTAEVGGVLLSSYELGHLVAEHLQPIDEALLEVIDETPAALRGDVRGSGVLLTGGGARLEGLDRHLALVSGTSARLARNPEEAAVRGSALAVDNLDVLKRNFMYIR